MIRSSITAQFNVLFVLWRVCVWHLPVFAVPGNRSHFCHSKPLISRTAGLFMLPLLPLMMENCAECTYPISEDISMGLMFAGTHTCSWRWCWLLCVT
jgi:hypothetical protein